MGVFWQGARISILKVKGGKGERLEGRFGALVARWFKDQWQQLFKLYKEDKSFPCTVLMD